MVPDVSNPSQPMSRRDALKTSTVVLSTAGLASAIAPGAYAGVSSTIQVALVGCGGRGTGAAGDAIGSKNGPARLVAMADVFEDKLNGSFENIRNKFKDNKEKIDVPPDRKFIGFEGYKQAMDCLKPGDVVILATPPAFRWVQFKYAIDRGLNVFMEKPTTVDGPSTRKMLELVELSEKKNLKVAVGLMCRHCVARKELFERIQAGEIGDILMLRAYRMLGPTATAFAKKKPEGMSELEYQLRNFHAFLWSSGGGFSDFLIHNIDECCWMKNAWPVEAKASGGRHYRGDYVDQNFDSYSVEYTFADGTKMYLNGRLIPGCHNEFASYCHGTKGSAVISTSSHSPAKPRIYKGQRFVQEDLVWRYAEKEPNPYQLEWDNLLDAIRNDKPYNEGRRGAEASLVTSMGRMAAHTGKVVTYDEMLNHSQELAPMVADLTLNSAAPIQADADGKYLIPQPGIITDREF